MVVYVETRRCLACGVPERHTTVLVYFPNHMTVSGMMLVSVSSYNCRERVVDPGCSVGMTTQMQKVGW